MRFYDFKARKMNGQEVRMDNYQGKVVLVVNTASKCGLTPQFQGLEELYQEYKNQGLEILGFPCNQFANQDKGSNEETGNFDIDDNSYVCITLDTNNYPAEIYSNWWNGSYPKEWTENGVRYWAIGITATDNNSDNFTSLVGGCQLIIEASRLV